MRRLFNAHVRLIYTDEHGEQFVSSAIADPGEFWWNERKPDQPVLWESKIYLGEQFFNRDHQPPSAPRHEHPHVAQTLRPGPRFSTSGLNYRSFTLRAPLRLTWRQLYKQFGTDPAKASNKFIVVRNFRQNVLRELKKIKTAWPATGLLDGSGRPDPSSLDTGDRAAQSRTANELVSPFPAQNCLLTAPASQGRLPGVSGAYESRSRSLSGIGSLEPRINNLRAIPGL